MATDLHFTGPYVSQIQNIIDTGTTEQDADSLFKLFQSLYKEPQSCGDGCCMHIHVEQDNFVKDLCKALMEYEEANNFQFLNYYQDENP